MKRIIGLLLAAMLCMTAAGCGQRTVVSSDPTKPAESEATASVTETTLSTEEVTQPAAEHLFASAAEFPRMDGSTANLPLMAQVLSDTTGMELEEARDTVSCTTTGNAWMNLAYGNTDILLVYEAAENTQQWLRDSGTELEATPIGTDALVFIVNENNPVESLTQEQLREIYTGKLTNWSQVGGKDQEIRAFQRDSESGSQSLFVRLLMQGLTPMEAPAELKPSLMGDLIEDLADYNNEGNALGYSVFYYASYMYTQPGLRFLAVDGVTPADETIADGSYPLLNPFYVVIRADEPEGSPARQLRDWLLTPEGTQSLVEAGYIPVGSK